MSSTARLRRLRKLQNAEGIDHGRLTAPFNAVKAGDPFPHDDSLESQLVRNLVATREAIEIVQRGILEEDEPAYEAD